MTGVELSCEPVLGGQIFTLDNGRLKPWVGILAFGETWRVVMVIPLFILNANDDITG